MPERPWKPKPGTAFRARRLGHPVVATYHETLAEAEAAAAELRWQGVEVMVEWLNRAAYGAVCPPEHVEHRAEMWAVLGRDPE